MSQNPVPPASPLRRRRWPWIVATIVAFLVLIGVTPHTAQPTAPIPVVATASPSVTPAATAPTTTPQPTTATPTTTPPPTTTSVVAVPVTTTVVTQHPVPAPTTATAKQAQPIDPAPACGGDDYINSDGNCVPRPTHAASAPPGATAQCVDGSYSFSQHRQGTCSHHGGVARWL